MSTIIMPEAAAPEPPVDTDETIRFVKIHANLLPVEITDARRARRFARLVVTALAGLLVLLIGWYGLAVWKTSSAKGGLASVQHKSVGLQNKVREFAPVLTAQLESAAIKSELTRLMAGDLQWKNLLASVRGANTSGMTITAVTATMTATAAPTAGATPSSGGLEVLNHSGKGQIGTLTITGTAPNKNSVATYVDRLAQVSGLAAAFPASITGQGVKLTFSVSVVITSAALGGRYADNATGGH
jgi:hypothetical protein